MPEFELHCCREATGDKKVFYYNSETSNLFHHDRSPVSIPDMEFDPKSQVVDITPTDYNMCVHKPSFDNPGRKDSNSIFKLKIQLGLRCNNSCGYCLQGSLSNRDRQSIPLDEFVSLIPDSVGHFQWWGGEPFLYWDILKPLAEMVRAKYPDAAFYMPTNGLLLDYEKNEWLDKTGFCISVSHDGPGQWVRGKDPLKDQDNLAIIQNLFTRLSNRGRFSFNPTISKKNASRKVINDWFIKEVGHNNFHLGEGAFFHPCGPEHEEFCLSTHQEEVDYRLMMLFELRSEAFRNMGLIYEKTESFKYSFYIHRRWDVLRQMCATDRPDILCVDLSGNILTCQNMSADGFTHNGVSHIIGNMRNIGAARLNTITHWWHVDACRECPVVQICLGGCPSTPPSVWTLFCKNSFSDNIPIFAHAIEQLTGYLPYYIEGDQREDRKDIFDIIKNGEEDHVFI